MEMLEKLPPEVLIYIQNVRKFLTTNEGSKAYFKIETHGDEFFSKLEEIANKNFENTGDAQLTIMQFEQLRGQILKDSYIHGVFMSLGDFGLVSLN